MQKKFKPQIQTIDLWPGVAQRVGGARHVKILDEIEGLRNKGEEERLTVFYESGEDLEGSASIFGITAYSFYEWYKEFKKRIRRGPRFGA